MISFYSFQDNDAFHITPGIVVAVLRCDDASCRAAHGLAVEFRWFWWCVAVVFSSQ